MSSNDTANAASLLLWLFRCFEPMFCVLIARYALLTLIEKEA